MVEIKIESSFKDMSINSTDEEIIEKIFDDFQGFINKAKWSIIRVPEVDLIV